jgi:hypothetical protein
MDSLHRVADPSSPRAERFSQCPCPELPTNPLNLAPSNLLEAIEVLLPNVFGFHPSVFILWQYKTGV